MGEWGGGSFGATEKSSATGVQRAKQRDSRTEDQCQPALTSREVVCSPARAGGGWRLRAEAQASEVRCQGEDWGWLCEHSLKGASAPQLAGRESGKNSGPERQKTIVLGCARRGNSFPVCPEKAEHCLNELQRQDRKSVV